MSSPSLTDSQQSYTGAVRERYAVLRWLASVDRAVYRGERAIVTAALIGMSAAVCLNIAYQFVVAQRVGLQRLSAGDGEATALLPSVAALVGVVLIARAAWRSAPSLRNARSLANVGAAVTVVGVMLGALAMVALPSSVVVAAMVLATGAAACVSLLDSPRPGPALPMPAGVGVPVVVAAVVTVVGALYALRVVPEGYSWAQKLALFLLLWVAFIGASMATHEGRHLRVEAVRKAVPERWMPAYDALSGVVAAVFTIGFAYLAWMYFGDRLEETTAPGQIPDWLKVLAIPVALLLVSLRFLLRAVESAAALTLAPSTREPSA